MAQENLKLREEAFLQGFSTSAELVDAQLFLSLVQLERSAAAYKYVVKLADTLALAGETYRFQEFRQRATAHRPRIGAVDER